MNVTLPVDNHTTFQMIETSFETMFSKKREIILHIDASKCSTFRFKTILKLMPILEKYREDSQKYLKYTTLIVSNPFMARIINFSLPFIKAESPVFVTTLSKL